MVKTALSGSVAFVSVVLTTVGLSAGCSSSSLGPPNGSSCNVDTDCASMCCVAGFDTDANAATAKVCSEPTACQDASMPSGGDSGEDSTATDSSAVDSSTGSDTGTAADSGTPAETGSGSGGDTGSPQDSGAGG